MLAAVHLAPGAGGLAPPDAAGAPVWIAAIPLLPLAACALCGLMAALRVRTKAPAWITVLLLGVSFAVTVAGFLAWTGGGWAPAHGAVAQVTEVYRWIEMQWGPGGAQAFEATFGFHMDGLSWLWMLFVTGLATLIALYASEYMSHDVGRGYARFFAAFALFVFSMACLVMGDNLVLLYLGWEGVGLCSYLLIGYFYKKPSAVEAAKKAFIVNRIGDLGLAIGIFMIYVTFGTVQYDELFHRVAAGVDGGGHPLAGAWQTWAIPLLLTVGAFGKSAQFPLYVWLPDAMEGPTPVSALIHAATMVTAGVYLVARAYPLFLLDEHHIALTVVAWTGALTALLAATIGMAQFDIKRIMAYSTVSQLGYMFAGLGVLTSIGAASHVFTHAFFKALLFLACGAVMHGFAGQLDLRRLSGVQRLPGWRLVGLTMLVGCLNLAGFPLITSGYFSKDMILAQSFTTPGDLIRGAQAIGWILLITAGLTAYYTFRVYFRVFVGPVDYQPGDEAHGHDDHAHEHDGHATDEDAHTEQHGHNGHFHPHAPGWAINVVLLALAVLSFAAIPTFFVLKEHHGWVGTMVEFSSAAYHAPEHGSTFLGYDPHQAMYYVSGAVGLIGIFVAFVFHLLGRTNAATSRADSLVPLLGPVARWAQNKWFVDEFYEALFRLPLRVLSYVFHIFDTLIVDGVVDLFGIAPRKLAEWIRPSQSGLLQGYALGMAGGIVAVLLIVAFVVLRGATGS